MHWSYDSSHKVSDVVYKSEPSKYESQVYSDVVLRKFVSSSVQWKTMELSSKGWKPSKILASLLLDAAHGRVSDRLHSSYHESESDMRASDCQVCSNRTTRGPITTHEHTAHERRVWTSEDRSWIGYGLRLYSVSYLTIFSTAASNATETIMSLIKCTHMIDIHMRCIRFVCDCRYIIVGWYLVQRIR